MTLWNVSLKQRQVFIKVKEVLQKGQGFKIIVDNRGKQHRLSEVDFPSFYWKEIVVGSTITLTVSEVVTRWQVQSPKIEKSIKKFIAEAQKKNSGLFFLWICEHCRTTGCVEYEDGDDSQIIAGHIISAHRKEAKPDCSQEAIRIFDHRGEEQKNSELLLSCCKVA
ncbi:MAG: hypothetical protein ABIG29_01005 [Candidatus Nealsonbacteria bacterium]